MWSNPFLPINVLKNTPQKKIPSNPATEYFTTS
jgi:hypothetical protein